MKSRTSRIFLGLVMAALPVVLAACGSSSGAGIGSGGGGGGGSQAGTVNLSVSDASTEDWAAIDVKILSVDFVPQGGGAPVTVYTSPSTPPSLNLVQLDQLADVLGSLSVPAGTYIKAILHISANPGDVTLTAAANPSSGFEGTPGGTVPSNQIEIQGATGSSGSLSVPVTVKFDSPLTVSAGQMSSMDVEFDLAHPAFLVAHVPPSSGQVIWFVNFNGPVRHHPLWDVTRLVLRHMYGTVSAVSPDNNSLTIMRDFPVEPPTSPETAITTSNSLTILADATNGTLFYDVDAKTVVTIKNFSTVASGLSGRFVRVAARYQAGGTLVATRIWAANSFNSVWLSPEGHVLHVNTSTNVITVQNEAGLPIPVTVDGNTMFFFRAPWNAVADSTPIGQGTGFLSNFKRGFKVHISVVDPLATPLVAQTVDIEIARFDGVISNSNANNFTYTRTFLLGSDNYTFTLPFISSTAPNGSDPMTGNPITGFKWWNFAYPTIVDSGANAISDFDNATNGAVVNFGGTVGAFPARGETFARWGDPANPSTWSAPWTVLLPTTVPLGNVAAGYSSSTSTFTFTLPGGANAATVNVGAGTGSATLVYQVDRTGNVVTVSFVDVTTQAGQQTLTNGLVGGTPVKVFGIPQASGAVKAYVVIYFTGVMPVAVD